MLTASYLVNVAEPLVLLWSQVEDDIVADVVRRIAGTVAMTETAAWQTLKLREMGVLQTDIAKTLASATKRNETQMQKMIVEACKEALGFDDQIYIDAGLHPVRLSESKALTDIITAGIRKTEGLMRNFTGTTATDASKAFGNALDRAWLQVNSGAFTPHQALRQAVDDLAQKGIRGVAYPSGHHDKADVAVRRALITGLNQTVAEAQLARADEMGCDLVEVTSHAGARPTHAVWQGQVFSRSGKHPRYGNFYDETGYGTGDGLCGWNCYHSFYPYFEGISKPAFERDPSARLGKTNDQVYEESQTQRYYERKVRECKRECIAIDAARQETKDPVFKEQLDSEFSRASVKLKKREGMLKDYCRQTDRSLVGDRISVLGYNHSVSSKATWANRKEQVLQAKQRNDMLTLHIGRQEKHRKGSPNYKPGKSIVTITNEKIQKIIREKSGIGIKAGDRERVIADQIVGVNVNPIHGHKTITDKATIHHSKDGSHLVPTASTLKTKSLQELKQYAKKVYIPYCDTPEYQKWFGVLTKEEREHRIDALLAGKQSRTSLIKDIKSMEKQILRYWGEIK